MFTEMVAGLATGTLPDPDILRKRFDVAVVKKLGVVKLPPAFWMNDPKINPRSDHLFWAALLTQDPQRIEYSLTVLAAEIIEKNKSCSPALQEDMATVVHHLVEQLFEQIQDDMVSRKLRQRLQQIIPEWINPAELLKNADMTV